MVTVFFQKQRNGPWWKVEYAFSSGKSHRFYLQKADCPLLKYHIEVNGHRARSYLPTKDGDTLVYYRGD